jgi:hypothetical protein
LIITYERILSAESALVVLKRVMAIST